MGQVKIYLYLSLYHRLFSLKYVFPYARKQKYLQKFIKIRPKATQTVVSRECGLNFDQ